MHKEWAGNASVEKAEVEHPDAGETKQKARCHPFGGSAREACRAGSMVALDAAPANRGREACKLILRSIRGVEQDIAGARSAVT